MSDKNWQLIEGADILNRRPDEAQIPSDYEPVLTISAEGVPILESVGDVVMPANYSFECINNFVHCESPMYEDLQNLALGMAGRIAMLESEAEQLRMSWKNAEQYADRYHWTLPILIGGPDTIADARAICLAQALLSGLDGDAAIDAAIAASAQ